MPVSFTLFFFPALMPPYKCAPLPNFHPIIFGLTIVWLVYFHLPFVYGNVIFYSCLLDLRHFFSGTQLGHKTTPRCI